MPLDDTGLVVRYYLDEAASGSSPTQVNDSGPNAYHLTTINYDSGDMAWVEDSGNRGLDSTTVDSAQRALVQMGNLGSDVVRDALHGGQKFCIEIVVDPRVGSPSNARLFCINDQVGSAPQFGLSMPAAAPTLAFFWEQSNVAEFDPGAGRHVIHVVVDVTQTTQDDRTKFYVDGVPVEDSNTDIGSSADTLDLSVSTYDLLMLNRNGGGGTYNRSPDATLYYAAIYTGDFDAARVEDHYDILVLDDDTPSPPGPEKQTFYMTRRIMVRR